MSHTSTPGILERKPYILAIIIFILLVSWMASGMLNSESPEDKKAHVLESNKVEKKVPSVEVTRFSASNIKRSIELYGRTEPDRIVALNAEVDGRVASIDVKEGQKVSVGETVVQLALEDKLEQLNFAKALLKQREIEYEGAKSLQAKGLQGESILAQAKAALVEAKALVSLRQNQVSKSTIVAPFEGVVEMQQVEVGSFVNKGQTLFNVVDLSPLVVRAYVTENDIAQINQDAEVNVRLVSGKQVPGRIRYLASVSELGTNTFPIEIEIDNPNLNMKAGVSTEIRLAFSDEQAIKVSPALLSLDKDGNLGVKSVENDIVVFTPIDLIKAEQDGVWLGGFSGEVEVITRGQGFVRPGDKVKVTYTEATSRTEVGQ